MRWKCWPVVVVIAMCLIGCSSPTSVNKTKDGGKQAEEEIKLAFAALQTAIKAKDADKIWDLLAKDRQDDADAEAKAVKEAFGKLDAGAKTDFAKKLELSEKELADINGRLYVKSAAFYKGETDEMPGSKLDKVVVSGESATVHYTEDGGKGEKEKRSVVHEKGQWRFALPIPKAKVD